MKKTSLALRTLTQGVRTKIDLLPLVIEPENLMAVILQFESIETRRIGAEELEHFTLGKQRSQVNDPGISVLPDDFDDAEYNRLCTLHRDDVSHLSSPACAFLPPLTTHSSIRPCVRPPTLARDQVSREAASRAISYQCGCRFGLQTPQNVHENAAGDVRLDRIRSSLHPQLQLQAQSCSARYS